MGVRAGSFDLVDDSDATGGMGELSGSLPPTMPQQAYALLSVG
jgi:hypothetical protein